MYRILHQSPLADQNPQLLYINGNQSCEPNLDENGETGNQTHSVAEVGVELLNDEGEAA